MNFTKYISRSDVVVALLCISILSQVVVNHMQNMEMDRIKQEIKDMDLKFNSRRMVDDWLLRNKSKEIF